VPRWILMWGIALALYAACKGLTYRDVRRRRAAFGRGRLAGYLLAWPGMDAAAFLASAEPPPRPSAFEWVGASMKAIGGGAVFWCAAGLTPDHPYPAGWLAMAGILFVLHFGLFHVLSCAWRDAATARSARPSTACRRASPPPRGQSRARRSVRTPTPQAARSG